MGQSNSRPRNYNYHQYYNAIKNTNFDFNSIDYSLLDPYEVLNISKNFTWNELKEAYKNTAIIVHPDKKGGNKLVFDFVTNCFKKLALEFKEKQENKTYDELKKGSSEYYDNNKNNYIIPDIIESNGNFNEKFNKTFDKCKLVDDDQEFGYGSMMEKSSKNREDINIDKVYNDNKFDTKSFNDIFNRHIPVTKEMIKYKEPEPLQLAKSIQYSEIGSKKKDDYSSSVESSTRNNLVYTDYMKAYSNTRLIDPDIVKTHKDFKSVEEYEKYRNNKIKKELTDKEKKRIEDKQKQEEKEEYERLERIKERDFLIQRNHEKASRLFIR